MNQEDNSLFHSRMSQGAKNVISSSRELFEPTYLSNTQHSALNFAASLEALLDEAPEMTPAMEETLDASREAVRQFIKSASQLYGSVATTLEKV